MTELHTVVGVLGVRDNDHDPTSNSTAFAGVAYVRRTRTVAVIVLYDSFLEYLKATLLHFLSKTAAYAGGLFVMVLIFLVSLSMLGVGIVGNVTCSGDRIFSIVAGAEGIIGMACAVRFMFRLGHWYIYGDDEEEDGPCVSKFDITSVLVHLVIVIVGCVLTYTMPIQSDDKLCNAGAIMGAARFAAGFFNFVIGVIVINIFILLCCYCCCKRRSS